MARDGKGWLRMARDGSISPEGWITCYVKLLFEKSLRWFRWLRMDEMVEMAVFTCVRFWCNKHLKSPKYIQPRKLTYLIS